MNDATLISYIDEVFNIYDFNRSGTLEVQEMHLFFNDLFQRIGDPRRYNSQEIYQIFAEADLNRDGRVDRNELLRVCKFIFNQRPYTGTTTTYYKPLPTYTYTYYVQRPVTTSYVTTTTTYY